MTSRLLPPEDAPQILVVDDTLANRRLLTDILEGQGYRVRPASSGSLALKSAAIEAPDLVLLDVKMPDMDGYEVCRRLKADAGCRGAPVIFISAIDEAAEKVRGFKEGGVDYIAKPFQAAEVLARVETHLTLRRLHKQLEAQNALLHREIGVRQRAEEDLRRLNDVLEERVEERTKQLQESQALLRSIIDNSTAVIYVKDLEGRYLLINRRFEALFHISRQAVVGRSDYDLFPAERAEALRAFDRQVLDLATVMEAEELLPQDDGLRIYLSIKAPLMDESGLPYALCGISADITERKLAEDEIRRLNEALEQKIDELVEAQEELVRKEKLAILGQLSGSVGHELRNPLGVMNNAVYFLKMVLSDADKTTKDYLEIIKHEIDNSLRIITDLLDFARTRAPRIKAVSVRALTDESLGRCAIPENVALRTEIADRLPLLVGDPQQMEQVLRNLIVNGIQAMPAGGELRIGARIADAPRPGRPQGGGDGEPPRRRFVEISVADTGEGIAPENMKKLFQPLFTTKAKGMGLGLALCKNLAEANGGRIGVESRPGEGAVFTLTLPLEKAD